MLTLVKAINALDPQHPQPHEDADTAPGPIVVAGTTVTFTYAVSVDGLSAVRNVTVTDNRLTGIVPVLSGAFNVGDTDQDNQLDPGEIWVFRATATALVGLQTNIGTATGVDTVSNASLSATDPANYTGTTTPAVITIVKAVNAVNPASPTPAEDANNPSSPVLVAAGDDGRLHVPRAHDGRPDERRRRGRQRDAGQSGRRLQPDARQRRQQLERRAADRTRRGSTGPRARSRPACTTNIARASGVRQGTTHRDDDPASVFGWVVEVDVQKATNAADPRNPTPIEDGDTAPGQILLVGTPLVWTYLVTNTGNVALTIALSDDFGHGLDRRRLRAAAGLR